MDSNQEKISPEDKARIIKALNERIPSLKCPICGNKSFILGDGYTQTFLTDNLQIVQLGGDNIPGVILICKHCGFISNHALGVIGLTDKFAKNQNGK